MYNIYGRKLSQNYLSLFYILLSILLKIVLVNLLNLENLRIINSYYSEIYLIIEGNGSQKILNDNFKYEPSAVIVNGDQNVSCKKACYFPKNKNKTVILVFLFISKIISTNFIFIFKQPN